MFAELVAQIEVHYKIIAGVPAAVPSETGGDQDVIVPAAVFVLEGRLHLMPGHEIRIGGIFSAPVCFGIGVGVGKGCVVFRTENIGDGKLYALLVQAVIVVGTPDGSVVIPEDRVLRVA